MNVDLGEIEFKLAEFDLGNVENVVDQAIEMGSAVVDILNVLQITRRRNRSEHLVQNDFGKTGYGIEGRAQFVAHVGEKFGLAAIGEFGALERFLGRRLGVSQGFLALLEFGDVGAQADRAPVIGHAVADVQPPAIGELLFIGPLWVALAFEFLAHPFFRVVGRLGEQAAFDAGADDVLITRAGHYKGGARRMIFAVFFVALHQAIVGVE